jgi:hypothetical protein
MMLENFVDNFSGKTTGLLLEEDVLIEEFILVMMMQTVALLYPV